MPPKKVAPAVPKDDSNNADAAGLPRETRLKRGANYREYQEEGLPPVIVPPFEVESLDFDCLRKYRKVHRISSALETAGSQENPQQAPRRYLRVEKEEELTGAVKRHWANATIKESDAIVSFLYAARNQDRTFKMKFVP